MDQGSRQAYAVDHRLKVTRSSRSANRPWANESRDVDLRHASR
jgi:hypothetical protein